MTLYQHYIISLYSTAITIFCLAVFVSTQKLRSGIKIPYVLYSLCISIWGSGQAWALQENNRAISLFAVKNYCHSGVILIPIFFIHFVLALLDEDREKKNFIILSYLTGIIFLILNIFTPLVVRGVEVYPPVFNLVYLPGYLHPVMLAFFVSLVIYGNFLLLKRYRKATRLRYIQLKWLCWITILAYIGGAPNFLLGYRLQLKWLMPFGTYLLPLYVVGTTYAIVRYHLLEIEVVVRKTIVFAGLFTFVFGAFIGTAYLAQTYWADIIGTQYLAMAIAVLVIVLIQEPLKDMLVKYTNRFLLQKKYDYQKVLRDASEGMAMVRETKWLLGLMTHIISSKMRVSNIGIFLEEDLLATDHYFLKAKRGKEPINLDSLSKDNPICLWLKENKKPLVLEEIDYLLQRKGDTANHSSQNNILTRIKSQMQSLNSKVIIPAYYKGGLLGFLSLGYKLSGDTYTKEDLILLSTLSSSAAVAIENARLFDSLLDEIEINNQLRKEEEDSYIQMMMSLAKTIDAKDSYTYDHVEMVYQYGVNLSEYLPGVNKDALKASLRLHDLGKIGVPDSILSKQGPLDAEEWKKIKEHTVLGARILSPLKKFEYVAKIILHHQEKFDGTGYPGGLKGDQIPLEARIISVVDAYHAMISDRPYRKALPKETAVAELKKFSGTQFDPAVVQAFLKLLSEKYGVITS